MQMRCKRVKVVCSEMNDHLVSRDLENLCELLGRNMIHFFYDTSSSGFIATDNPKTQMKHQKNFAIPLFERFSWSRVLIFCRFLCYDQLYFSERRYFDGSILCSQICKFIVMTYYYIDPSKFLSRFFPC